MFIGLTGLSAILLMTGSIASGSGSQSTGTWSIDDYYLKYPLTNVNSTYCYTFFCDALYQYTPYEDSSTYLEHDVKILNVSLTDTSVGAVYSNYIEVWLSYAEDNYGIVANSMQLTFKINDTESPDYPKLNYYFYATTDILQGLSYNVLESYSTFDDGFGLIPLWQSQNFPTISLPTYYRAGPCNINLCFVYVDETTYSSVLREYEQSDYNAGYSLGYDNGKHDGIEIGANDYKSSQEYQDVLQEQYDLGKQAGISEGRTEVIEQGQTATVIFNGIISVALLPVNVFLRMLNLEVFGINLGALVSSLLTICVIIILARMIFGKNGE